MFPSAYDLVLLLIDVSLKALFMAAIAATGLAVLRVRNSHVRHRVWTAVLCGMLLMPGLTRIVPAWTIPVPTAWLRDMGDYDVYEPSLEVE